MFYSDSQIFRVSMALADRYPSQTTSILLFNITKMETSIGLFTIPLRKYHNSKDQPVIFQPLIVFTFIRLPNPNCVQHKSNFLSFPEHIFYA
jgi:hypothetical protein